MCVLGHSVMSDSFRSHGLYAYQAPLSMDFSGQEYRAGCHFLLQGVFPTQGSNLSLLCFLHWQEDSLPLCHLGSLRGTYLTSGFLSIIVTFQD